ncbi:XrtA/PEP-CTERM system TPR-repeat protein PrsT [Pelagibius marinus]|uniref:XrtA/PEP-CTERM system TPR-repeat protein PrsT n=1 Tax=Pelagibius marinus TaxID=2762760 RepID=UPI0018723815|nr:XrtA/PEP-CTERM system TPR-repeat protein PrsT [Pelagibius marinus]
MFILKDHPFILSWARLSAILFACGVILGYAAPALAKMESDASRAHYESAVKRVEAGDLRAAIIELKNALQQDRTNPAARLLLGEVYLQLGNGGSAEKELRAAKHYGTDEARVMVPLARAMLLQGRFKELLGEFPVEALAPPNDFEMMLLRAEAYIGLGQFETARSIYDAAAREKPEHARIHLGLAQIAMATRNFEEAETYATTALALEANLVEALLLQAEARRLSGQHEGALALFGQIVQQRSQPAATILRAHIGRAATLIALDRDAEAEQAIASAREIAPEIPLAAYLRALIKVRQRDFKTARQELESASLSLENFLPAQFLFGVVYYASGNFETARTWLLRFVWKQPENLPAKKLLAATFLRLNAFPEAIGLLEPVLTQAPDDPQILFLLGDAYLRDRQAAKAASVLRRAAENTSQDPRILSQLAISYLATGQRDEALTALNATLDLGVDASAIGYALAYSHLRSGAFDSALNVAQELRKRFPQSAIAANLEGGAYAALGQLDRARASFGEALAIDPSYHPARANQASLKAKAGDFEGAEAEYDAILAVEPGNLSALLGMAALANRRGDQDAKGRWLVSAVEADPNSLRASIALAEHQAAADSMAAAIATMEGLAERQRRNPQVLLALARFQSRAGQSAAAVQSYERLVEISDGSIEARQQLAEAYLAAGDLEAARSSYERLKEAAADNPIIWNNLAVLYRRAGDRRARAHAERALELAPDEPAIMDTLGWILLDEGEIDRAAELLRQAHKAAPATADITYHYAEALRRKGENQAARQLLQSLLAESQPFSSRPAAAALLEELSR